MTSGQIVQKLELLDEEETETVYFLMSPLLLKMQKNVTKLQKNHPETGRGGV